MRRGITLVELIVTLTLLGVLYGLTAATLGGLSRAAPDEWTAALAGARARAVRTGQRVRLDAPSGESVLFLPDGRAIGRGLDPLTGAPTDASR